MTHLYIEQNTGLTEEVNSSIISKLYELAISGDLDETSDLKGRLHSGYGYGVEVQYLTETFLDLYITLDKSYIKFADAAILDKMKMYIGDGNGATIQDVQNIQVFGAARSTSFGTVNWFDRYDTKILPTTFDEFELFINVTELYTKAFESWINLQSIKLPPNITTIGSQCFDKCYKITSLTGLSNITTIPDNAFRGCSKLETIDIDFSQITKIGNGAFSGCSVLQISSVANLESIVLSGVGIEAFKSCEQLTFPQTITISSTREEPSGNDSSWNQWLERGFQYCNLTNVIIGSGVKGIGYCAFDSTGLTSISAPNVMYISGYAFSRVNAEEIILPSVTKLMTDRSGINNYGIFINCPNLKKVVLGHIDTIPSVNKFDNKRSWFYNNPMIETLDIGDSVQDIQIGGNGGIFDQTGNLSFRKYIIRNTSVPQITFENNQSFDNYNTIMKNFGGLNNANAMIYVPDSALNDYKAAQIWSIIADRIHPLSEIESNQ